MGLLRWLLRPRRSREEDEDPNSDEGRGKGKGHPPGVYRVEIDGEARHFRGEGPPFSFWASSRIVLILAFLLWWIQPAGPMIAGYVGGRRAGSPIKAVLAALLPVIIVFLANVSYAHTFAARQIDFVASLPSAVGDGVASILPFLVPYKEFMVAYMEGFVRALQTTFGMGTNGYLMVIIFAYIGGLIAEQTRRELYYRSGATQTVGVNLVQPLLAGRHLYEDEEDEELREMRRPVRARGRAAPRRRHRVPERFEEYRKISAEAAEGHDRHRTTHPRPQVEDEEDEEDEEEPQVHRRPSRARADARHERDRAEEEDAEAIEAREAQERETRRPRQRSHEEEIAIQRFVERALRHYDHSKL